MSGFWTLVALTYYECGEKRKKGGDVNTDYPIRKLHVAIDLNAIGF